MTEKLIIRGGVVADGTGAPLKPADILIENDLIADVGDIRGDRNAIELDASGCIVSPGFINMLSHAYFGLQRDPRGLSDLYQGVTTEVFGEGISLGPVVGRAPEDMTGVPAGVPGLRGSWPSLRSFLTHLEHQGVGFNVASFVGAANLRMAVAGPDPRPLTPSELSAACDLLDRELSDGALGVGSALIYPPGSYADTSELCAFAEVLATHDAMHISHMRSEGDRLLEAVEEQISLAQRTGARAEIYHLKAVGQRNWHKMAAVLDRIERARGDGVRISANVYPYAAGATALLAAIPPAFRATPELLQSHLASSAGREAIRTAIAVESPEWENLYALAGGGDGVIVLTGTPALDLEGGLTLTAIAEHLGVRDAVDALLAVVNADPHADAAYFLGDEDNVRLAFERPWVSVGSDSDAPSIQDVEAGHPAHPRSFGAFTRVLSRYARDERRVSIEEAVRRLTSLPATSLGLEGRGVVREGAYADLAVFALDELSDRATYLNPGVYATGMRHVLVNGTAALRDGQPTGNFGGRALRRART
ncbi:N-acyl-D-amino-acid deacylase family protein [Microbacterium sp. NIBRBAC000506063]|uniref:N-acyl-D-amino-acid deacylase family protein n=1 Tax=Microbacterium sp. NIBRBAC000506063 TaxID=2734618 RepID=UPI001BB53389|nr:amidohydrolase family protein [Microbacterium sp. NIBRBAC000506063]QTV79591.1 amidohydrolase family protein [Microbacterium sp. NIBRBAC000506063]